MLVLKRWKSVSDIFLSSDNTDLGIRALHVGIYFQVSVQTPPAAINVQSSAELTSLLDVHNTGWRKGVGGSQKLFSLNLSRGLLVLAPSLQLVASHQL